MNNVFAIKKQLVGDDFSTSSANTASSPSLTATSSHLTTPKPPQSTPSDLPDYLSKFRTRNSLPPAFRDQAALPDRLAVTIDRSAASKVVDKGYERQKKIE